MHTPSIYVACLAAYNSGFLHGKWISADRTFSAIYDEIQDMLRESPIEDAEEFAIHDYEGFGNTRFGEYEDLETVVKYVGFKICFECLSDFYIFGHLGFNNLISINNNQLLFKTGTKTGTKIILFYREIL